MSSLTQDLRYGLRTLANNPGSTAAAIAVLSLGIGANVAIFSVTNAVLFRSLPYQDPGRLVFLWGNKVSKGMQQESISPADYKDFQNGSQALDGMGAIREQSSVLIEKDTPERIETAAVSPNTFHLLGLRPILGRSFSADEDQPGKNHVVILSAGLWERRFGRDPEILGKTISLDGGSYAVVGIAPVEFRIPASQSELWIPYTPDPTDLLPASRGVRQLHVIGRLQPGITLERAQGELQSTAARLAQQYPDADAGFSVNLTPLREQLVGGIRPTLWLLTVAVVAVLLIACVNLAHLLLARAAGREREIAVRAALGASAGRLMRQLLTESVVLALTAGLLGLLLAYWGTWAVAKLAPSVFPEAGHVPIDWRVLAFTLGVSTLTGLIFGLVPALVSARSNLNLVLRSGGRGGSGSRARARLRDMLLVCEVAFSAALLVGAGLLVRSFARLQDVNPGFRPDHVLTMQLSLPPAAYADLKVGLFFEQLLDRVRVLPGVQASGICRFLPLNGSDASGNFQIEGQPVLAAADQPRAKFRTASGGYFSALGIPLIRGRVFDRTDTQHTPKVVVINQTAARRYWPNQDPIGKRILSGLDENQWSTIIGVVGDIKQAGLDSPTSPETYYHYLQIPPGEMNFAESSMALVIRTTADPAAMTSSVREALHTLDPAQPIYNVQSMDQVLQESVAQPRFRAFLIGLFAALALVLASIGLYGVVAYSVSQRTAELGIRVAVGARPADIVKLVVFRAAGLAAMGLVIGIGASLVGSRLLSGFLFEVSPSDPFTLGVASIVILAVALTASLVPALRAAKVDPVVALRAE